MAKETLSTEQTIEKLCLAPKGSISHDLGNFLTREMARFSLHTEHYTEDTTDRIRLDTHDCGDTQTRIAIASETLEEPNILFIPTDDNQILLISMRTLGNVQANEQRGVDRFDGI